MLVLAKLPALPRAEDGELGAAPAHVFRDLYDAHFRFVWRALRRLGVREADLMDLTQNVFVIVHRKLTSFEGRSDVTTWLFGICRRVARDYRRSAPIRREVPADARSLASLAEPEAPPEALDEARLSAAAEALLDRLPEKLRVVFVLFELEEMSGEEIALLLQIPVGTVRSRLRLAREAFQREVRSIERRGAHGSEMLR